MQRPGERQRRRLVTGEEQRHHLVAQLRARHGSGAISGRAQLGEQRARARLARVDDGIDLSIDAAAQPLAPGAHGRGCPVGQDRRADRDRLQPGHRLREHARVTAKGLTEERSAHHPQRQLHHRRAQLDHGARRPGAQGLGRLVLDHAPVAQDALVSKPGLDQPPLSPPALALAEQQAVAEQLEVALALAELRGVRDEHVGDRVRVPEAMARRPQHLAPVRVSVLLEAPLHGTEHVVPDRPQLHEAREGMTRRRRPRVHLASLAPVGAIARSSVTRSTIPPSPIHA